MRIGWPICVGDVVGKGITAALLMANLQAALSRLRRHRRCESRGGLQQVERFYMRQRGQRQVHLLLLLHRRRARPFPGVRERGALSVRNWRGGAGDSVRLCGEGAVLGVLPDWKYRNNRLQLESGDRLVLFTDGVTEAEDVHGDEFGEERLVQSLQQSGGRSAEDIRRRLMESVTLYCDGQFRDDATVVVLAVQ